MKPDSDPYPANDPSDQALDRLLAQARWDALPPGAAERLRRHWLELRAQRPIWLGWGLTAAAAALLAVAVTGWMLRRHAVTSPLKPVVHMMIEPPAPPAPARTSWREPTPYERLLVASKPAGTRQSESVTLSPASKQSSPVPTGIDERTRIEQLLKAGGTRDVEQYLQLVADSATREAALETLKRMPDPPLGALFAQLNNPRVAHRLAAAKALGEICQPDVARRLCLMVETNVQRREALAALTQCHEPAAARFLTLARGNPVIDAELRSVQMQMKQVF